MPVEKLKEETTGEDADKKKEPEKKDAEEAKEKEAAAVAPKPGIMSRFGAAAKKKTVTLTRERDNYTNLLDENAGLLREIVDKDAEIVELKATNNDPFRFQGDGVDYKGKLIGIQEVPEARGDKMCQDAMQMAKAIVKTSGQHKQRILLNISLSGIKLKDEKTGSELYQFPVSKISFIARDVSDSRAFGFIYGTPESKHKFYGIKTAQTADQAVLAIRDMFHIVYEVKKKQLEEGKDRANSVADAPEAAAEAAEEAGGGGIADLLCLEAEVAGLEQGMGNQDWATFEAAAATDAGEIAAFNKSDLFTSSTGSTAYPANDADSSSDPFGGSFNTTISSNQSGPLAGSTGSGAVPAAASPYDAFAGLDLGGAQATPTPASSFMANGGGADPFDTSHVGQVLGYGQSTPVGPSSGRTSWGLGSISSVPASLYSSRASDSAAASSVFESPPTLSEGASPWGADSREPLDGFNTGGMGSGLGSLLDSPPPADLVPLGLGFGGTPEAAAAPDNSGELNLLAGLKGPEGIDGALGKLTADLMGGTKKSAIPGLGTQLGPEDKVSPFDRQKKAEKKSINEMMGGGGMKPQAPQVGGPKAPLDISQLYAQAPPPQMNMHQQPPMQQQMPQNSSNPFLLGGAQPPAQSHINPFAQQQMPPQMQHQQMPQQQFGGMGMMAPPMQQPMPNNGGFPQQNMMAPGGMMGGPANGGFGGGFPLQPPAANGGSVRPRPTPVPATGAVTIGDPFADPFFK